MKILNLSIFCLLTTLLFLSSCNTGPIEFDKAGSPHYINKNIKTKKGQDIIFEAGSQVIIGDSVYIRARGNIYINGTADNPVHIKGKTKYPGWGQLQAKGETKIFRIDHAIIEDGTLTSYNTDNHFSNIQFNNAQGLNWEWAIARFWYGKVLIENCTVKGDNTTEGFLLHDVNDAMVRNCDFTTIPDAVEFISCDRGEIRENVMRNGNDDGIDLNACVGTKLIRNKITGYKDAGLELGSQNFGRSSDLIINQNYIANCKLGVIFKESTTGVFKEDTIINNNLGFDISTPKDSTILTELKIEKCILENGNNFQRDERSIVEIIE